MGTSVLPEEVALVRLSDDGGQAKLLITSNIRARNSASLSGLSVVSYKGQVSRQVHPKIENFSTQCLGDRIDRKSLKVQVSFVPRA